MTSCEPEPLNPQQVESMASLLRTGMTYDEVIRQMRALGWNKIDCIKTLRDHAGIRLGEAKDIVHLSPAWADTYEADEALHDTLERVATLSDEEAAALIAEEKRAAA